MASPALLPLPRPEYIATPELLISSLAWRLFRVAGWDDVETDTGKRVALAYQSDRRRSPSLYFVATDPCSTGSGATLSDWLDALEDAGLMSDGSGEAAAEAIAMSIRGTRAPKAKGQAASPLSPGVALLQNLRGLLGRPSPPNVGLILECLFALGSPVEHSDSAATASGLWHTAANTRLASDPLLKAIDVATRNSLLKTPPVERDPAPDIPADMPSLGDRTPYTWLRSSWVKLTSPEWVAALPARRWVDWATALLRAGIAFGYLWEARWYRTLGEMLVSGIHDTGMSHLQVAARVNESGQLIPWLDASEQVSIRDVSSIIREELRRGEAVRRVFERLGTDSPANLALELAKIAEDSSVLAELREALVRQPNANDNAWEAVKYSLATREHSGRFADHYGLLTRRGPYHVVDPETEWIAVVASLSCRGPGSSTTVGTVARNLRSLGLRPGLAELTHHLERAGLARTSADADTAVKVQSAY